MNEKWNWRPGDTLRSMYAVVTILGGAALDLVANKAVQIHGDFGRLDVTNVEAPCATEEELG